MTVLFLICILLACFGVGLFGSAVVDARASNSKRSSRYDQLIAQHHAQLLDLAREHHDQLCEQSRTHAAQLYEFMHVLVGDRDRLLTAAVARHDVQAAQLVARADVSMEQARAPQMTARDLLEQTLGERASEYTDPDGRPIVPVGMQ